MRSTCPGTGAAVKDVGDGSLKVLSDSVAAYLDAAGIVHLVGHSKGGAIALHLALHERDRIAFATLLAPAGIGPEINMEFIGGFIRQTRARKLRGVLEMFVAEPGLITGEVIEEVVRFKRLDGVQTAFARVKDGLFPGGRQRPFAAEEPGALQVPDQAIWGEEYRILPVSHAETVPVLRLAGTGHLPHMERAGAVNDAIQAFAVS